MEKAAKAKMVEAVYKRGETAFANGKYQETVEAFTKFFGMEKAEEYQHLEIDAHNTLGMLFFFAGYENAALDQYLSALMLARKQESISVEIPILLNVGLLYQKQKEYGRAMAYYMQARELAEKDLRGHDMLFMLYTDIQIAQLDCRMGQFEEAKRLYTEIENFMQIVAEGEFLLSKWMLDILLAAHAADYEKVHMLTEEMFHHLRMDEPLIDQMDFYVDACEMIFHYGNAQKTGTVLQLIREKIEDTDFSYLKMRLEQIEVSYQKQYGSEAGYKAACKRYLSVYTGYEELLTEFCRKNLQNIGGMQQLEEQKHEFERRSRCDLTTGLLNKKAFQSDVEMCLAEYAKDTMNAMVFLDIDNFKSVNDNYGHLFGDEVICALTEKIKQHFCVKCVCGRFGGDEFTIFIKEVEDMLSLECKMEEFREEFSKLDFGKGEDMQITLSIGVSYNCGMRVSYQAMLSCADEALEKAKEYGKNRVSYYEIKRGNYDYA